LSGWADVQPEALWRVIFPMKDTRLAKSRLGGVPRERRRLAIVMARDTLCAAVHASYVEGVVAVCDREEDVECFALPGVTVVVRAGLALNDAILAGAAVARADSHDRNLAVLPGDLPYLRSAELDAALANSAGFPSACVGDRTGRGTTLLTARAGTDLAPAYGVDSLALHRERGAVELGIPAWSGLRRDVDVPDDLAVTYALSPRTRRLMEKRSERYPEPARGRSRPMSVWSAAV
jgi:2-phospho-L-lactate guanylyltransferase